MGSPEGNSTEPQNGPGQLLSERRDGPPAADHTRAILERIQELPTISPVASRLLALTGEDDAGLDQIIGLIEIDPILSSRLLSLCRRASMGVNHTVTTVRRAVALLGLEAVQAAVLSVQVYETLSRVGLGDGRTGSSAGRFDRVGFWRHSIAVATLAESLAVGCKHLAIKPDEAFVCGLVHDLGKLALDWALPKAYDRVLEMAESRLSALAPIERRIIGLDHHAAGKRLAELWSLPHAIIDCIWLHGSEPAAIPEVRHQRLILLVGLCDAVVRRLHLGWSGSYDQPEFAALAEALGISAEVLEQTQRQLHAAVAKRCEDIGLVPSGASGGAELVLGSLAQANQRLGKLALTSNKHAQAAKLQRRVLSAVGEFLSDARCDGGLTGVASAILTSFRSAVSGSGGDGEPVGQAFLIVQTRSEDPWRVFIEPAHGDGRPDAQRAVRELGPVEGPTDATGEPIDLGRLCSGDQQAGARGGMTMPADSSSGQMPLDDRGVGGGLADLGTLMSLVSWMADHLAEAPDVRTLRLLAIPRLSGAAAVVVYSKRSAGASTPVDPALCAAWARALVAAVNHEGARHVADRMAETTRKLEQAQVELSEARALARLGELTAGAAHELNNPLAVISGRAQLLASGLEDGKQKQHAEAIVEASVKLTDLITRLHEISQAPELRPVLLSIKDLIADASAEAKRRFVESAPGQVPASVRVTIGRADRVLLGDRAALGLALSEVILNAMQSSPATGIAISAEADPQSASIRIQVADDGRGMSEHAVLHAFDPFFSERASGRSTGLGLTLARRNISIHGGLLRIRSTVGQGTSVTVELPVRGAVDSEMDQQANAAGSKAPDTSTTGPSGPGAAASGRTAAAGGRGAATGGGMGAGVAGGRGTGTGAGTAAGGGGGGAQRKGQPGRGPHVGSLGGLHQIDLQKAPASSKAGDTPQAKPVVVGPA